MHLKVRMLLTAEGPLLVSIDLSMLIEEFLFLLLHMHLLTTYIKVAKIIPSGLFIVIQNRVSALSA